MEVLCYMYILVKTLLKELAWFCPVGYTLPAVADTSCPAELMGRVLHVLPPAGRFFHGYEGHRGIQEDPERGTGGWIRVWEMGMCDW